MKQMPISKQNDRLNGDMTLRQYERGNAGVRLPGRNGIGGTAPNTAKERQASTQLSYAPTRTRPLFC